MAKKPEVNILLGDINKDKSMNLDLSIFKDKLKHGFSEVSYGQGRTKDGEMNIPLIFIFYKKGFTGIDEHISTYGIQESEGEITIFNNDYQGPEIPYFHGFRGSFNLELSDKEDLEKVVKKM